jgi:hypothetical protein
MTELALNILHSSVDPVTEWYRLLRADVRGVIIKKVEKQNGSKGRQEG